MIPAVVFLDGIKSLDYQHGTQIYRRLRYILSDISLKTVEQGRVNAKKHHHAKPHVDAGILQFEVHGAKGNCPAGSHVITSSYLYDSISQPIIAKIDGQFHELHLREYIDENGKYFQTRNQEEITPLEFKKWLQQNDIERLSSVNPSCFGSIHWEMKLVRIPNITQYSDGLLLQ